MDWMEKIFGVSPDGGNGVTEALFILVAIAIVALIIVRVPRFRDSARRALTGRN